MTLRNMPPINLALSHKTRKSRRIKKQMFISRARKALLMVIRILIKKITEKIYIHGKGSHHLDGAYQ